MKTIFKWASLAVVCFFAVFLSSCGDGKTYVEIETEYGVMKAVLYEETPIHKANFIKLIDEGFYDSLLFHRVMKDFMIQGGDPRSYQAPAGISLGNGGPKYTLKAELGLPHFRGALAAARQPDGTNPQRESSGSQFFIVDGVAQTDASLDGAERRKGFSYSQAQRDIYKEIGGRPDLDGDYTVFGELVSGWNVIDAIAAQPVNNANRPLKDVVMQVRVVN